MIKDVIVAILILRSLIWNPKKQYLYTPKVVLYNVKEAL